MFIAFGMALNSCEEYPNAYEVTDGTPTVNYIRLPNPESSDSLIVSAFLNKTITLIGDNLTSVKEIWFNDRQAYLNSSFMTSNSLFVTIPNEIPGLVTDKIYMITNEHDTIQYNFHVQVPPPASTSMLCEFVPDGGMAVIKGNYFIDDKNVPLEVFFPGNLKGEIVSVSAKFDQIVVKVPTGAGVGPVTVKSIYGSGRSSFYFRDDRNYILDWDKLNAAGGWRAGVIANSNPAGISGNYVRFNGDIKGAIGATWGEDEFSFNLWGSSNGRANVPFFSGDLSKAVLKFECNVVDEWKSGALQMIFTPYSVSGTNGYIADGATPRGLWMPWVSTGSFKTDGWITVTIPMSDFHFAHDGKDLGSAIKTDMLGGLTFFVFHGGVEGKDSHVQMCIDNIRIVSM
jgi:hypothetical protein